MCTGVPHPAKYSDKCIPIFATLLSDRNPVLDPFAGTGKLALIKQFGFTGKVVCNELEPEWITTTPHPVDEYHVGDAAHMSWAADNHFAAICTSPTYGNRKADHYNNKHITRKVTYTHALGRPLHTDNTGILQWGQEYRTKHTVVYAECIRVLSPGGLFIVNIANHIRRGVLTNVTGWHKGVLKNLNLNFVKEIKVDVQPLLLNGNTNRRPEYESILIFRKPKGGK